MRRRTVRNLLAFYLALIIIGVSAGPVWRWGKQFMVPQQTLKALYNDDVLARRATLRSLSTDYTQSTRQALLEALEHTDATIRYRAASYLTEALDGVQVKAALLRHLRTDPAKDVRLCCAAVLMEDPAPEVTEAFIGALKDPDKRVIQLACATLRQRKAKDAIRPLFVLLNHLSWIVRLEACKSLIELKATDQRVLNTLKTMARDRASREYDAKIEAEQQRRRKAGQPPDIFGGWGKLRDITQQAQLELMLKQTAKKQRPKQQKSRSKPIPLKPLVTPLPTPVAANTPGQ